MDRKHTVAEEPEEARGDAGPTAAGQETERVGPVEVRRLRKDDGRALIVYSREPPPG
jgi:hypothetical protein